MEILEGKDPELWKIAQKRASFKKHLYTYLIVNGFLWFLWYMGKGGYGGGGIPWPVWPTAGWGIGLAFNYFDAYHGDKNTMANNEYEKLKRDREGK